MERLVRWASSVSGAGRGTNGSVATTLGDHARNFAWGGATAIRRDTFERIRVAERWGNAASDDYALTRAVKEAGLGIRFVPRCLMIKRESAGWRSLLEFTTRQIIITRVYRPSAWWTGLISHGLFCVGFLGGIAFLLARIAISGSASTGGLVFAAVALVVIYLLGSAKGVLRLSAASIALPDFRKEITRSWWMFCVLWPLVSVLFLYNFVASSLTRRITWRGVCYELVSDRETKVVGRAEKL